MGRNNSVNNRFGYALTPLVDLTLSLLATSIPISLKNAGRFASALLNDIDENLAKYSSAYGFDFHRSAPISKQVSTHLNNHRPIWLRKKSFAIKRLIRRNFSADSWIDSLELRELLDTDRPWTRKYFLHDQFRDEGQLQRLWTVEYLVRQLSNCSI
jgi:asparagine synthase (glutamine-hydrolysing)